MPPSLVAYTTTVPEVPAQPTFARDYPSPPAAAVPAPVDGVDMWPYLSGSTPVPPRNEVVLDHRMFPYDEYGRMPPPEAPPLPSGFCCVHSPAGRQASVHVPAMQIHGDSS